MPFDVGQSVGPYRILEQLGQGGMATVYKAYHASLDRHIALKVLHPALKDDDTFYLRFQREAQIVARLDHPNIVPIHDFAMETDEPYIVMKLIEGQTLKQYLKRKHLSLEETLRILPAIAEALTYAHNRGILHRDVKPSNVMLDKDETPYLTDFGLARIVTSGESTMSQDVLIGTPNYISPEQARGDKTIGPATDIYSLGIMLYEIVVGRVPFMGDTPYAVVHDHIYKPLPMPTQVNPTVPPAVESVLLRSLAKDPADRYPSAVAMLEAFEEAIHKADLRELSAASVLLERFVDSHATMTPATAPSSGTPATISTSPADLKVLVRAALDEALAATPAQQAAAVPPVVIPRGSSRLPRVRRQRKKSRRGFWFLAGLAGLVFTCIAMLGVAIGASRNPILQSNPALRLNDSQTGTPPMIVAFGPPNVEALGDDLPPLNFVLPTDLQNVRLEDILPLLEGNPDDSNLNLLLSYIYLRDGDLDLAEQYLRTAISSPNAEAQSFALAAAQISAQGFSDEALLLWLAAYKLDPTNPEIRNTAGQFLYRELDSSSYLDVGGELAELLDGDLDSGLARAMVAHALQNRPRTALIDNSRRVKTLLDSSIEAGDALPEAYLIYGDYYLSQGEGDEALDNWQYAITFVDTPTWVQNEAERRIAEHLAAEAIQEN
jgi:serine/threonine-protein kinase